MANEEKKSFYRIKRGTLARREETGEKDSNDKPVTNLVYYGNEPGQKAAVEMTDAQARAYGTSYLEKVSAEEAKKINGETESVQRSDPNKGPSEQGDGRHNDKLTDEEQKALEDQKTKTEAANKAAAQRAASTVKPEGQTETKPNFDEMSVSELREYAEAKNINLAGQNSKAEILATVKRQAK